MAKRIALVAAGLLALWILIQVAHDHQRHPAAAPAASSAQSAGPHHRGPARASARASRPSARAGTASARAGTASARPGRARRSPRPAAAHPASRPAAQPSSHPAAAGTAAGHAPAGPGVGSWIIAIACIAAIAMSIFAVTVSVSGAGRDGTPNAKASP